MKCSKKVIVFNQTTVKINRVKWCAIAQNKDFF